MSAVFSLFFSFEKVNHTFCLIFIFTLTFRRNAADSSW